MIPVEAIARAIDDFRTKARTASLMFDGDPRGHTAIRVYEYAIQELQKVLDDYAR